MENTDKETGTRNRSGRGTGSHCPGIAYCRPTGLSCRGLPELLRPSPRGERLQCGPNEVMIGVHINKGKLTCAQLNFGYQIANRIIDPVDHTQVSSNPSMHGCPPDYLIQALSIFSGDTEELTCVSLRDSAGQALSLPNGVHDGRGPDDDGTQSTIYGIKTKMHVCGVNLAMRGIHRTQNDLFCAG